MSEDSKTEPSNLAPSDEAGEDMHVHKPKAAHSLREFLAEISVIVVGIAIALAGEQAVEWLHWRHVLAEERESLNATSENIYRSLLVRVDLQPCVDTRLADIATILKRHNAGKPLAITGPVGRPSTRFIDLSTFDMALADQAFSHMSFKEKRKYFAIRHEAQIFTPYVEREFEAWRELRAIDHVETFTPQDWYDISKAYDQAADVNEVMRTNIRMDRPGSWLFPFREVAKPDDATVRYLPWVKQLCQPSIVK